MIFSVYSQYFNTHVSTTLSITKLSDPILHLIDTIFENTLRPNPKKNMVYGWDPMPELTTTSPYVHSRVDSNTFTMGNPMPESTFYPSQGFGFSLCFVELVKDTGCEVKNY